MGPAGARRGSAAPQTAARARAAIAVSALSLCGFCASAPQGDEPVPIFDGETLDGWRAVPEELGAAWSVRDGAIQGKGMARRLSYLVYAGDEHLGDFELAFSYRMLTDGNTGVEVRARPDTSGKRPFEGYHADLGHVGIGPNILGAWDFHFATRKEFPCGRGTRLVIDESGAGRHETIANAVQLRDINARDWNRCRILARGAHLQFVINGLLSSEFVDGAAEGRLETGLLALQLHDDTTTVQFRDILLKRLR